jgi:hypothetical protein
MAKFNITQWSDFVRDLAPADTVEKMQNALEGQRQNLRTVELLRQVAEVGRLDHELEIPHYALRGAKAIGSLHRPEQAGGEVQNLLRYLPFEIIFDSLLQPAAMGTRNLHASDRQFVFEAADYTVEVRIEQEADPISAVLVGELLRNHQGLEPVPHVPVLVTSGSRIVARSNTGRFGEFQAEGLPTEHLSLALMVGEHECIQLPLHTA